MVAAPAAFASDFVTGVAVGKILSDDSGSKKVEDTGPESKTVIDYHDGQPVVTKVEAFKSNKWRKLDGPQGGYFVCPGEYRSYFGKLRCRINDDGFNGFVGGMTDAQELPLQDVLTKMEGKPISLQTIEVHGNNMAVKYQVVKQEGEVQKVASSFPFLLVLLLPVLIFFAYRAFMINRRDSEIVLRMSEARLSERTERPSNEPPSVDELRERQQQNTEREPVVVSSSAPAPKVQKEEPIEVQPGKRKIILD
jgi:hypothetical protein